LATLLTSVGPYRIERELGRGGMGVVCLGHDPRLGRAVALKALPDHLATDPDRLARFEREARTLASLTASLAMHTSSWAALRRRQPQSVIGTQGIESEEE
jgi:serine/threonine-protein kinase